MAKIVHMQRVVPPPIDFDMGDGRVFRIDGTLPVQTMLTFAQLEAELVRFQEHAAELAKSGDEAALEAAGEQIVGTLQELCDEILKVLQIHTPDLAECPFDQDQVGIFLAALRGHFEDIMGPDPTPPSPKTAGTTKTPPNRAARRRSTPSSGSRASRSSSAGRPTTGTS